jgi:hypothetical protein
MNIYKNKDYLKDKSSRLSNIKAIKNNWKFFNIQLNKSKTML